MRKQWKQQQILFSCHSPRKIQFTVPLLEPHLDPEAAEQVRSGAGRQGSRPAEDEGPQTVRPQTPAQSSLSGAPLRGPARCWGGVFSPLPHRGSPISPSVLLRDGQKDERLPSKPVLNGSLSLPSPALGEGACLRTRPLPPFTSLASPTQSNPARVSELGGDAQGCRRG